MKRNTKNFPFSSKLRGSRNIVFPASEVYEEVRKTSSKILKLSGYREVILSSFDYESTFASSVGEDTDIVQKEMFTFSDKKGRKLALRPEGTACIAKMIFQEEISKGGDSEKIFYWSNMFRYERSQKGRYREFWQLGVEVINFPSEITSDCELLHSADRLLSELEVKDYCFHINYLGDKKTIEKYSDELKKALSLNSDDLCKNCKLRYLLNPLRVADCEQCCSLEQIPDYGSFLSENEASYFERLKLLLSSMNIKFFVNKKLVRGINYYNGLVFECKTNDQKRSLLGGGRYDKLVYEKNRGCLSEGSSSVGFAIGVDRLIDFCKQERIEYLKKKRKADVLLISFSDDEFLASLLLREELQTKISNLSVEVVFCDGVKNRKVPNLLFKFKPLFSVFYGDRESISNKMPVVNHDTGSKFLVKKELLADWFTKELEIQKIPVGKEKKA